MKTFQIGDAVKFMDDVTKQECTGVVLKVKQEAGAPRVQVRWDDDHRDSWVNGRELEGIC